MDTLRELTVGIDFDEFNLKKLLEIDNAMDEIEDGFSELDRNTKDASKDMQAFGDSADSALSQVRNETHLASGAMDEFGDETRSSGRQASDAIDDVNDEVNQLTGSMLLLNMISRNSFNNMNDGFNYMNRGILDVRTKISLLGPALVVALSAGVAATGPLIAALGAIASSMTVAGIASAGFGAVAVGALTDIFEASEEVEKAQEKIATSDTWEEEKKARQELAKVYDGLSDSQRGALNELQAFKSFWGDFVKEFEEPVFDLFSSSLEFLQGLLKRMAPTIEVVAGVFNDLMDELNTDLRYDDDWRDFFEWLEDNAARSLKNFAETAGNFIGGFINLLQGFTPISDDVEGGLLDMSERFKDWSNTLDTNKGFQNFIEYAKENGPLVLDTFGELVETGKNIVEELAPIGTKVLEGVKNFAGAVNDNWPAVRETVVGLTTAVGSFVAIMGALKVISFINALLGAYRAGTVAAMIAQWGFNAALWANPITWIVAGIAALIGVVVLLIRNWDLVKEKTVQFWNVLYDNPILGLLGGPIGMLISAGIMIYKNWDLIKDKTLELWHTLQDAWNNVWDKTQSVWYNVEKFVVKGVNSVIGSINDLIGTINKIPGVNVPIIPKIQQPEIPEVVAQDTGLSPMAYRGVDGSHASGLYEVPHDDYVANLHRGESVLTANQSQALKATGILSKKGERPQTNISRGNNNTTNQYTYAPQNTYYIDGGGDPQETYRQARQAARDEQDKFWRHMNAKEA